MNSVRAILEHPKKEMNNIRAILEHPNELYPLLKLQVTKKIAEIQIPQGSHWEFCYSILPKVSRSFFLAIQQLDPELRNVVCVFYLVTRALGTIGGRGEYKVLMDQFYHVSTAFLELKSSYREIIEEGVMKQGEGSTKFMCKEIETIDDYDEYCSYLNGSILLAVAKIFHASGSEALIPDSPCYAMGCLLQKANVIKDYLEDINEKPKPRLFWPREIWSKYVKSLEGFKFEENSNEAMHCLNEMVTNALMHVEDCLKCLSAVSNPGIFRFWAIPEILAIGTLALCYGNTEIFRGQVKLRRGLTAKIINQTRTMADVYGAFYDFSSMLKSKVNMNDPSAEITMSRIESIQKTCWDSGTLEKRKSYTVESNSNYIFSLNVKEKKMLNIGEILMHPDEVYPLFKLRMAQKKVKKLIPREPHWGFCYSILPKVSHGFALLIQQLNPELRDTVCILYLVLRALDTVEDDTSIATEIKVPILMAFHRHIYDRDWHFACGTKEYKVLMDQFRHVSTALLELNKSYQDAIKDITMRMGAGMAKFICKEVETIDDYDEYCHYVAGLVGLGLSKLFHAAGTELMFPDSLSNSMGLFLQKTNIIRDYLEDINEIPKSRMFWPRQIWSKYVNKLEDLKYEENSEKAVQCLNDMVTNALIHIEDCLKYMSDLRDPAIFKFCAIPQIMAIGTLALCYNNIEVFRGVVKMRRGLRAKLIDRTRTMADVYGAFYDFSSMLKDKIDMKDPNAKTTMSRIEAAQKICRESGALNKRKSYIINSEPSYGPTLIAFLIILLAIVYAYLSASQPNKN